MPELPELEVVREVLRRRVVGQSFTDVEVLPPGGHRRPVKCRPKICPARSIDYSKRQMIDNPAWI